MLLFPNFKDSLSGFSSKLDEAPRLLPCPLLLGIDFSELAASATLENFMSSVGFLLKDASLWQRDDEVYENHFLASRHGYISLGEINDWRNFLWKRSAEQAVALYLPLAEELVDLDTAPIKTAIDGLILTSVNVKLVYHLLSQPKDQAALFVALDLLDWPHAWQILFDDMFFRKTLTPAFIASAIQAIDREFDLDTIIKMIRLLHEKRGIDVTYESISSREQALKQLMSSLENYK